RSRGISSWPSATKTLLSAALLAWRYPQSNSYGCAQVGSATKPQYAKFAALSSFQKFHAACSETSEECSGENVLECSVQYIGRHQFCVIAPASLRELPPKAPPILRGGATNSA